MSSAGCPGSPEAALPIPYPEQPGTAHGYPSSWSVVPYLPGVPRHPEAPSTRREPRPPSAGPSARCTSPPRRRASQPVPRRPAGRARRQLRGKPRAAAGQAARITPTGPRCCACGTRCSPPPATTARRSGSPATCTRRTSMTDGQVSGVIDCGDITAATPPATCRWPGCCSRPAAMTASGRPTTRPAARAAWPATRCGRGRERALNLAIVFLAHSKTIRYSWKSATAPSAPCWRISAAQPGKEPGDASPGAANRRLRLRSAVATRPAAYPAPHPAPLSPGGSRGSFGDSRKCCSRASRA